MNKINFQASKKEKPFHILNILQVNFERVHPFKNHRVEKGSTERKFLITLAFKIIVFTDTVYLFYKYVFGSTYVFDLFGEAGMGIERVRFSSRVRLILDYPRDRKPLDSFPLCIEKITLFTDRILHGSNSRLLVDFNTETSHCLSLSLSLVNEADFSNVRYATLKADSSLTIYYHELSRAPQAI